MKSLFASLMVLLALPVFAQTQTPAPAAAPAASPLQTSGGFSAGLQQFDNSTDSSKFTEYRDIRDNLNLLDLRLNLFAPQRELFMDFSGSNVGRRDQRLGFSAGKLATWRADVAWSEIPHVLSNRAQSPYVAGTDGVLRVPQTMSIPFKKLGTSGPDTGGVLASDAVIASYAQSFIRPVALGNQTNAGTMRLRSDVADALTLDVQYSRRTQDGTRLSYGPIGDRPPRTLNIELAEPVDYRTNDMSVAAEHDGGGYQARVEYLFSDFANQVDTLVWQNVYATPAAGANYDVWDRLVAAYGVRPLAPDNRYHSATASAGLNTGRGGRLSGLVAYGRLAQNETLLPYAYQNDVLRNPTLPRATADAGISTLNLAADYTVTLAPRLNLRAFVRRADMDSRTPSSEWQYVTSDTTSLTGTVSYVNKRVSVPYATDRQNAGGDATWRIPGAGSLTLGYEHEGLARDHREADTSENILRAGWRARANSWLTLRAKYLLGARDGGTYHNRVTEEGYWYAPTEANDNNNPRFTFDNHPDMRRYDVSDRRRDVAEFTGSMTPGEGRISVSATLRYRRDDFDSDVQPEQPLIDTAFADRMATSPGDQLGLLRDARTQASIDVFFAANDRVTVNGFVGWDRGDSRMRSLEFNENNKANPSAIATAELGPWTRGASQWTSNSDDHTASLGGGATVVVVPGRASLSANYTASLGRIDIEYGGYGVTNWDGTPFPPNHQFFFQTPPQITQEFHLVDLRLDLPLVRDVTFFVGYTFDRYRQSDWQQETSQPWVEPVGSEYLLRDTSRSFQWGNRLFSMGSYLAPAYTAHMGSVGFNYRF